MKTPRRHTPDNRAAIVCYHVAVQGLPILWAIKDEPVDADDSGWQFLCNSGRDEDQSEAQVWSLSEVCEHTPSVEGLLKSEIVANYFRKDEQSPWKASEN